MKEKACKICNRLVSGNMCPACKTADLSKSWKGVVEIFDAENSQVAKEMGITAPGRYAIRVK